MKNCYGLYILKTRNSVSCRLLRQQFYLNFIGNCLSYTAWSGFSYERIKYLLLVNACLLSVKGVKWDSPDSFMCIRETTSYLVGRSFIRCLPYLKLYLTHHGPGLIKIVHIYSLSCILPACTDFNENLEFKMRNDAFLYWCQHFNWL